MLSKMTNPPEPEWTETVAHGSPRPRVLRGRVLVGAGMLEPIKTFRWRGETFTAGRTRVAPEHPVCSSEAAKLLVPCYSKEDDPRVLEVYERATGRRWDAATSRASAPARTTAGSIPLYGTPEYHRHRERPQDDNRPQDDGAAAKAILQRHYASVMFVGPKLEREILASNAKRHVKN
jgi:hypothetical protein